MTESLRYKIQNGRRLEVLMICRCGGPLRDHSNSAAATPVLACLRHAGNAVSSVTGAHVRFPLPPELHDPSALGTGRMTLLSGGGNRPSQARVKEQ